MKQADAAKPQLSILIPVYNEEKTIRTILKSTAALPIKDYEIIVVDDASHDKSPEIIKKFVESNKSGRPRFHVYTHEHNKGKGAAIQTGLARASGHYFVIQDADLEYTPGDVPALLEAAIKDDRPVVYGSRFLGTITGMPKPNYYANRFYNFLLRRLYDTAITDMHTCYKMLQTDLLKELEITSSGFDYATEIVSKVLRRGLPIHEVPISFNGRTKKQGKKIGYGDGVECTYKIIKYRFAKSI